MAEPVLIAVTVVLVLLYIILIAIPSPILNGLILTTFIKYKELHTPSNLLSVHFCVIGLIVSLVYSPLTIAAFITVMLSCNCNVLYFHWTIGHIFHFSLYPLSILLLTISYFVMIKYSPKQVTFRRVFVALGTIWVISTVGHVPILFLTPQELFVECCELVCLNETAVCNSSLYTTFTPHVMGTAGRIYYNIRVELLIIVPSILVFVFSMIAYCVYKKAAMQSTPDLKLRMLLLPPLMTFSVAIFILGQDVVNWQPSQIDQPALPGVFIFVVMGLIWDSNGVYFALLILYFNVRLRNNCLRMLKLSCCRAGQDKYKVNDCRSNDTPPAAAMSSFIHQNSSSSSTTTSIGKRLPISKSQPNIKTNDDPTTPSDNIHSSVSQQNFNNCK